MLGLIEHIGAESDHRYAYRYLRIQRSSLRSGLKTANKAQLHAVVTVDLINLVSLLTRLFHHAQTYVTSTPPYTALRRAGVCPGAQESEVPGEIPRLILEI